MFGIQVRTEVFEKSCVVPHSIEAVRQLVKVSREVVGPRPNLRVSSIGSLTSQDSAKCKTGHQVNHSIEIHAIDILVQLPALQEQRPESRSAPERRQFTQFNT